MVRERRDALSVIMGRIDIDRQLHQHSISRWSSVYSNRIGACERRVVVVSHAESQHSYSHTDVRAEFRLARPGHVQEHAPFGFVIWLMAISFLVHDCRQRSCHSERSSVAHGMPCLEVLAQSQVHTPELFVPLLGHTCQH